MPSVIRPARASHHSVAWDNPDSIQMRTYVMHCQFSLDENFMPCQNARADAFMKYLVKAVLPLDFHDDQIRLGRYLSHPTSIA